MLSLSIPIWLLVCIIVVIVGAVFFIWIRRNGGGAYDFVTPFLLIGILGVTVAFVVGILFGKFVF
ncbi:hypothetical protein [Paenibacillus ehimensis]|uniref:Uncharacterized protein n=1 Tax=Paenibacillus ehimensis TaxID=79264 RepID=A0ABT8VMQ5_9BACL|nr:hypothetical protein [Paenibacillus ehimensis]MDO3682234.1 hypothetical protein [Paenibacillus ehimensis]